MRDTVLGTVTLVSVNVAGTFANGDTGTPVISPDGRYVAFDSRATDLVVGDTNGCTDVLVRDVATATSRASVSNTGAQANQDSWGASMTPDASRIAFVSLASNLVANDINANNTDAFVRDRTANTTRLVSRFRGSSQRSLGGVIRGSRR